MDRQKASRVLFEFADIADSLGVRWCLLLGTCLGIVRDGDLIEYDDDLDLGVLCDKQTLVELFDKLVGAGFTKGDAYLNPGNEKNQHFFKDGILVDVFFTFRDDTREFLTSFDEVHYNGRRFHVPHPVNDYLTSEFGDWRTPQRDKSRGPGIPLKGDCL